MNGLGAECAFKLAADNEHRRAMHQRPERKHETRMLPWASSQTLGQTFTQEIERGPGFMQRRRLAHAIEKNFIGVTVFQSEVEVTLKGVAERPRLAEGGK